MDIQYEKGGFTMRPRTLLLFALAVLVAVAVAVLPALAASPSEAKLEVSENCVEADWPCWAASGSGSPASVVTITAGGEVMFTDKTSTAANIAWTGTAPTCSSGVPVSPTSPETDWEGKCKFEQPGTYKFESSTLFIGDGENYTKYEIVVESASTGTTSTTATTTTKPTTTTTTTTTKPTTKPTTTTTTPTTTTTTSAPSHGSGSPLEGGSRALNLAGSQRGSTVHGSIKVSQAGSGGRLEVGLFATDASLAKAGYRAQVRVGRLARSSLKVGSVSFSVPLSAKAKSALRRHRRLTLKVKVTLTPQHGAAVTITRVVVVHS
jgi:cell division septation protein DedD